jgi:hypothetical protein
MTARAALGRDVRGSDFSEKLLAGHGCRLGLQFGPKYQVRRTIWMNPGRTSRTRESC